MKKIILGSQSKLRKQILGEMGYEFETMVADVDEKSIRFPDPAALTRALARAKNDALIPRANDSALLLTSDTVCVCNGEIFEKPEHAEDERRFFAAYAKYPAVGVSSVVITDTATGKRVEGTDVASVYFATVPDAVLSALIADGAIFGYAGGFTMREPSLQDFILKIEGEREVLEGLPVALTRTLLSEVLQ